MPVILAIIISGGYIISEVMKEHKQMYGFTQQDRERKKFNDAINKQFEAQMREIWGDDWKKKSNYWRQ